MSAQLSIPRVAQLTDQLWTGGALPYRPDVASKVIDLWRTVGIQAVVDTRAECSDEDLVATVAVHRLVDGTGAEYRQTSSMSQGHWHSIADPLAELRLRARAGLVGVEAVRVGETLESGRLKRSQGSLSRRVDVPATARCHKARGDRGRRPIPKEPSVD